MNRLGSRRGSQGPRHRRRRLHRLATSFARCSSAATTCACSTTSPPATARTSPASRTTSRSIEGELRSYERVHNAVRGVELVFHQGALPSVPRSVQDPLTTSAVTIEGTLNVLLAARDESVRRVVFASSSSVYGNCGTLPRTEAQQPDPISPYAVAKLAAERYCVSFHRVYGLETVALRYFNVFGPRQDPGSQYAAVVPRFIAAIDDGRARCRSTATAPSRATSPTSPTSSRRTCSPPTRRRAGGTVLNVATGRQASVNELADAIGAALGRPVEKEYLPARTGDVRDSWADISAAARARLRAAVGLERRAAAHGRRAALTRLNGARRRPSRSRTAVRRAARTARRRTRPPRDRPAPARPGSSQASTCAGASGCSRAACRAGT